MKHPFYKLSNYFKFAFISILMLFVLQKANAQYPSIPGNPTTLQNTNTPDPFGGTFYNGGNAVYTIGQNYAPANMAFCIDRSVPVCDGTKNPLTPGVTNTNNQLAYALYLLHFRDDNGILYTDDVKRELIWALMGQTNNCSANSACAALLTKVQALNTSTPLQLNIVTSKTQYNLSEKVVLEVTTNVSMFFLEGGANDFSSTNLKFCDASGNTITPPGASITIPNGFANVLVKYPVSNPNSPTTYYLCFDAPKILSSYCWNYTNVPAASNVTIWEKSGCQPLIFMMPPNTKDITQFNYGSCSDITLLIDPAKSLHGIYGTPKTDFETGESVRFTVEYFRENTYYNGNCPGTGNGTTYAWSGPNNYSSALQNPTLTNITTAAAGIYTVTANINYGYIQCTASSTVSIKICGGVVPGLSLTASPLTGVLGVATPINFTVSLPSGATINRWMFSQTDQGGGYFTGHQDLPVGDWTNNMASHTINKNTNYWLWVILANGCKEFLYQTITFGAAPTANLSLRKSVSKVNPIAGESIVYSIDITNAGPQIATNVVLKDLLPAGLTFVSVNTGTYVPATGLWTIGTVPVGTTTITMTVTVN